MGAEYTKSELAKFDLLTMKLSSRDQVRRIDARLDLKKFEEEHGHEKCQAMFKVLQARDAKRSAK